MATLGHEIIHQAGTGFDRVISVGDGPWDLRAAIATGSQFIGIGESTAPFGAWFPRTHLFASLDDPDPTTDFTVAPPAGQVAEPDADKAFTARPPGRLRLLELSIASKHSERLVGLSGSR